MNIRHFDIKTPTVKAPGEGGWEQLPLGYYRMTKCLGADRKAGDEELYSRIREAGNIAGGNFQQDCLLSILADIKRDEVNIFELGAGWGRICLNIAGAIDFKVIPCTPTRYHCLAVEAEPVHYEWLKEHFAAQNINGMAVLGAVSNKNGSCYFDTSSRPDYQYGQAMSPLMGRSGMPSLGNLRRIITGKATRVPMLTIDRLVQKHGFDHVDIIQMDVQGAEYHAILGAANSIKENMIDYLLINIHHEEYSQMLPVLLSDKYNLIIDLKRVSLGIVEGFPPIHCNDGIQLYKRNNL